MTNISVLVLICALSACGADELFDEELYRRALDPALCSLQLTRMRQLEFNDASFRAPEGLLVGNLASLGNYHQCLAINQHLPDTNIQGKYCLIRVPVTLPTIRIPSLTGVSVFKNVAWTEVTLPKDQMQYAGKSLSLAVCVPKSCTVEPVLAPYTEHPVLRFNYTEQYCRLPDDKPFSTADHVAKIIFSALGMLTLISTAYELRHIFLLRRDPEQASKLLRVCSLYTNTRRLLTFEKPRPLDCVDGIRSLSILWIVVFHTFCTYFNSTNHVINSFEAYKMPYSSQGLWIASGTAAVNTFFTLTGLLIVYTSANKDKRKSLLKNLHLFYLNRYLRLFPLLATAVLLQASLLHRTSDGPGWHIVADQVDQCRRFWWSALLHVQNIVNISEPCLIPTWYMSVDMQLYVVSPLMLYWVLGSRRAACTALAVAIFASVAVTFAFCLVYNFPISRIATGATADEWYIFNQFYYQNTLARSPPFFIGMLFGYILHIFREQKVKLSQVCCMHLQLKDEWKISTLWTIVVGHSLALFGFIYVIYIVHPSMQEDWNNQLADNINNTLRPTCWSLAVCWTIFACVHGYGGPVNWFLSLRLWKFGARISYAMYLFHFQVLVNGIGAAVASVYFNIETLFFISAAVLVYTLVISTAACVLIEEPALTLQKILFRSISKCKPKKFKTAMYKQLLYEAVADEDKCQS